MATIKQIQDSNGNIHDIIDTTYSDATTSTAGLMSAEDKTKLNGIKSGAEPNVQSDWSETNTSSDAFIKNKPTIPTIPTKNVIYNTHTNGQVAKFDTTTGTITASGYTIEKSVPSNAVFTDYQTTSDGHYTPSNGNGNNVNEMDSGRALSFGNSVITSISADEKGHITAVTTSYLPANPNTDTKNTAGSTNSSSKLYLIGATSQAANPQTYSHDTAYVGTDGCLYSNSKKVITTSDTVTTTTNGIMSARDKAKLDGIATNANNYSLPTAKYNTLGGLKPAYTSTGSATLTTTSASNTDTPTISSKSTEEGRYFAVEADANGVPYVNVPEATHRFSYTITSSAGLGTAAALTYVSGSNTYNAGSIIRIDFNGNVGVYCTAPHWFKYTKNSFQYNFKVGRYSIDGTFIDASDDVSDIAIANIATFFAKSFALFRVISITSATTDAQKILMTPIYYSSVGQLSSNSIVSENINVCPNNDNSSYNLLFASSVREGSFGEYRTIYTDSDNSLYYNPSTNILNVPSIISSSSCSFGSNTNVKSIFNIKGSNHNSDVISLVGNSSTAAPYVSIKSAGSSTEGIRLTGRTSSTNATIKVYSSSGSACTITGGSTSISSDERLKNFENDIEIDFDELKKIPKKYFTWKNDDEKVLNIGTSAQEVEKIYPEIVEEFLNENEGKNYKSVDYSKLSIIALAAIDKLNERIEYLENKIKELEQA